MTPLISEVMRTTIQRLAPLIWTRHQRALAAHAPGLIVIVILVPSVAFQADRALYPARFTFLFRAAIRGFLSAIAITDRPEIILAAVDNWFATAAVVLVMTDTASALYRLTGPMAMPELLSNGY